MSTDPLTLGLDSTDWTALGAAATFLGTMAALGIALTPWIKAKLSSPKLALKVDDAAKFSSSLDGGVSFYLRVPVANSGKGSAAENVEVFLESAEELSDSGAKPLRGFLPMRLTWTYANHAPVCDRITGETYKLLDFGVLFKPGAVIGGVAHQEHWRFEGEVPWHAPKTSPTSAIKASVIISADKIEPRRQIIKVVFGGESENRTVHLEEI